MTKISLYDIFTGSAITKWLESGPGIDFNFSDDGHSVIVSLSGTGPGGAIDISLDPNPTLGGDLNLNGHSIISNTGQNISILPGTGGQLILNGLVFPNVDGNSEELLGTDGNGNLVWYKVPGITNSQAGLTYYVDQSVATTGDGTKDLPFKTFQEALSVVNTGDTIVLYAGTYSGDYTIDKSITLLAIDGAVVRIFGKTTISSSVISNSIVYENNTDFAIDNSGTLNIIGGSLVRDGNNGVNNTGTMTLTACLINTRIVSVGSIELFDTDSLNGLITTSQTLIIHSATKAPSIDHVAGVVELRNAPTVDYDHDNSTIGLNVSIRSSANTGLMLIDTVSFKQDTGWSTINKTGQCDWVINNVGRNPLHDVLTGNRKYFLTEASDLSSFYDPHNYTVLSNVVDPRDVIEASITDHLAGIDSKLGFALSTPENVIWVSSNGSNSNNGSINQPYSTLSYAITNSQASDTIVVTNGLYDNETVVIDKNLQIVGFELAIFTNTTFEIRNGASVLIDKLVISSTSNIPLTVTNGSFQIYHSEFQTNNSTAIQIDTLTADSEIDSSSWSSLLVNADTTGARLTISGINSSSSIETAGSSKTYLRDSALVGKIIHSSGWLSVINVGEILKDGSGTSLLSTAVLGPNNFLYLNLVSTKQADGSYGSIAKTGNCDYQLGINDIGTANNFYGSGTTGIISSDQVVVNYTPSSYSATNLLTDHIHQIDTLLGEAVIKPSRLYYIDSIDQLNSVYSSITETTFGFDSTIYITPGAIAQFILNTQFVPGINLIGTGSSENVIVQMPTGIPNLHITSALSGMVHETLWRDIKLNSPVIVEQSLADDEIHFENMTINGDITVNYGKLIIRNSRINGILTIAGGSVEIWNSELQDRVIIGDGDLYINGVKQNIDSSYPSFDITGGNIIIDNIRASNVSESIFKVQGGKVVVTSLIIDSNTYNNVIYQDVGGMIYIGINNIAIEGKTTSGTIMNLGFGL